MADTEEFRSRDEGKGPEGERGMVVEGMHCMEDMTGGHGHSAAVAPPEAGASQGCAGAGSTVFRDALGGWVGAQI